MLPDLISQILTPSILLTSLLGTILGITLGALPGLTATMGIILIIPFTYNMDTFHSFAILLAVYVSGIYGGSISAILIKTPGTPSSAATLLDGYPMAQRGEAGRAIGIATLSSFFGGIFSVIALALIAPILSNYALRFGPAEFFALAVFGLTIIVTLSQRNLLKGFISGVLGLFIATIGIDPVLGCARFHFNIPQFLGGINFVVALIGLFAMGEVLIDVEKVNIIKKPDQKITNILSSMNDIIRSWYCWLISAIVGTFIGVLPGVGSTVAPWITYDIARRMNKKGLPFGSGNPEGIIATETANNACPGGAMITLISLGIPGDVITAILIGALMIQGLRPGPLLFNRNPEIVYGIIFLMFIANIFMVTIGLLGAKFFAKIVLIPRYILNPLIVIFSIIGAFALNNDYFDIFLMFSFGILGYIMTRYGYPKAPMILGMILGPIAESNFRRALVIAGGNYMVFINQRISFTLLIFTIMSILFPLLFKRKLKKRERKWK